MAVKYGKRKHRKNNIVYTIISTVLLCIVFLSMVSYFYNNAEEEAYEALHVQTKQIKDDMHLQLMSDRENLVSMANFAAKLYADGESYDLMFDSFKSIGLIDNIGILNSDNTFVTKVGTVNLDGLISFETEKIQGTYISGRVKDLTKENHEIIRSAVPIKVGDETVGILYGVIGLDTIGEKYNNMAKELDAQLFVHDKETGDLVIDTIHDTLGNISFMKDRQYNKGYSYEEMISSDKGFTSFVSAYTDENLYVHYSTIEDLGWVITLARYESQVFAKTHGISRILLMSFFAFVVIMVLYMMMIMSSEKRRHSAMGCASNVRKLLLEINQQQDNITKSLKLISNFADSRSSMFFDTDNNDHVYIKPSSENQLLLDGDREYFQLGLLRYAAELHRINQMPVNVMCITPNAHLVKTNPDFFDFLKKNGIREVSFAVVADKNNRFSILGCINPRKSKAVRILLEDVAVCFSIALYNKNHLNKTELAATTDSLTGVLNRVAYKQDLLVFDKERSEKFTCIYIDVNELHFRNNKYGHAAGDEMLLYIANTLKDVFFGYKVYRMGGDEFLVFIQDTEPEAVDEAIKVLNGQLEIKDYHVAIGISYRTQNTNTEEMVREAEIRMYEAKAQYYQNKEQKSIAKTEEKGYLQIKTGILEIDTMLSVLKEHYNGIYRVSLDSDKARRILMPAYLDYDEEEEHFSVLLNKYLYEMVDSDYHRALTSFLNYDALKTQFIEGITPKITYKKINGETVILSVYKLDDDGVGNNTLWVFAKD